MQTRVIEITGVTTANKGAELMLVAVMEHLRERCSGRQSLNLTVDRYTGSYEERAAYGLYTKLHVDRRGWSWLGSKLLSPPLRRACGLMMESDIDCILDASGFLYGDHVSVAQLQAAARVFARWKKQKKAIVLLPQAFGPFENPAIRKTMEGILDASQLVYARDQVSLEHLRNVQDSSKLRLTPDFTNLVTSELPPDYQSGPRQACIVPNTRMLEKTSSAVQKQYVPFLIACIEELIKLGMEPFLLLHDIAMDEPLIQVLQRETSREIPIVREHDPRRLKGVIGSSHLMIGSRFHALIGALSQAVPCLATGWSHKYEALLGDYGCTENLIRTDVSRDEIRAALRRLTEEPSRSKLIATLRQWGELQRDRVREMWDEVDAAIGLPTAGRHGASDNRKNLVGEPSIEVSVDG